MIKMDVVVFWEKYKIACKDGTNEPLKALRSQMGKSTLEIPKAETLTVDDWKPLLSTLAKDTSLHYIALTASSTRYKVLESLTGERDVRSSRRNPALYSKFVLRWLSTALSQTLISSRCLTSLFLSKIPMKHEYIAILTRGLAQTKSLQHLALHHCPVEDTGCSALCKALSSRPTLNTLDLTDCALTHVSASELAQLIQRQYCTRVSEVWKGSLRYGKPAGDDMPGLRRITLNLNPNIGDIGVQHLTTALYDDIWIKGVDMQGCGVKEEGALSVAKMLHQNSTVTVFDLRSNPGVEMMLPVIMSKLRANLSHSKPGPYKCRWMEQVDPPSGRVSQMTLAHSVPSTLNLPRSESLKTVNVEPPWMTNKLRKSKPSRSSPHIRKSLSVARTQSLDGLMHKLQFISANPPASESNESTARPCGEIDISDFEDVNIPATAASSPTFNRKPLISVSLENQNIFQNFKEALSRIRSEEVTVDKRRGNNLANKDIVFVDVPVVSTSHGGGDCQPICSQTKHPPSLMVPEAGDAGSSIEERHLCLEKKRTSLRQPLNNCTLRSEKNYELKRVCSQQKIVSEAIHDELNGKLNRIQPSASFSTLSDVHRS